MVVILTAYHTTTLEVVVVGMVLQVAMLLLSHLAITQVLMTTEMLLLVAEMVITLLQAVVVGPVVAMKDQLLDQDPQTTLLARKVVEVQEEVATQEVVPTLIRAELEDQVDTVALQMVRFCFLFCQI